MMGEACYFSNVVDENTWIDFMSLAHEGLTHTKYTKIEGYGWKTYFAFNPDGKALMISESGNLYKGIWFITKTTRYAIFNPMSEEKV
jgi:hypothetical protein